MVDISLLPLAFCCLLLLFCCCMFLVLLSVVFCRLLLLSVAFCRFLSLSVAFCCFSSHIHSLKFLYFIIIYSLSQRVNQRGAERCSHGSSVFYAGRRCATVRYSCHRVPVHWHVKRVYVAIRARFWRSASTRRISLAIAHARNGNI
jgi:hypothetical protein